MIEVQSITYGYTPTLPIFKDFSWTVGKQDRWAVIGPSACGKSTLLYLCAGLLHPSNGFVYVEKTEINRPRPRTGLIIQDYGLLPWATVQQNVELGLKVRSFYGPDGTHSPTGPSQGKSDIDYWINKLGLASVANRYPNQISGGQRQRTALARTLVLQPDLLLMDEPFSSLDAPTREILQNLTNELCIEQKLTLIIVTHAIEEAAIIGEKILVLSNPPNIKPVIIDNSGVFINNYRNSIEYQNICRRIRGLLE